MVGAEVGPTIRSMLPIAGRAVRTRTRSSATRSNTNTVEFVERTGDTQAEGRKNSAITREACRKRRTLRGRPFIRLMDLSTTKPIVRMTATTSTLSILLIATGCPSPSGGGVRMRHPRK
jgi:hypothetical protein